MVKQYRALFFDLDDTLLDFKTAERKSLQVIYKFFYELHVPWDEFQMAFHSANRKLWEAIESGHIGPAEMRTRRFEWVNEKYSVSHSPMEQANFYENCLVQNAAWLLGARESLQTLKETFQIAILTNGLTSVQRGKFQLLNLGELASIYLISEEIGISKPHPKIFELALESCGLVAAEVLMVGDSLSSDFQGALNAEIDFCWVNPHDHLLPAKFPSPAFVIKAVSELPELICASF